MLYNYGIPSDGRIGMFVEERDRGSSSGANDNQAVVIGVANDSGAPNWSVSDEAYASLIRNCHSFDIRDTPPPNAWRPTRMDVREGKSFAYE